MKLECIKDTFKWAILLGDKLTAKNVALPTLGKVLLVAKGKSLVVKATNLDIGGEFTVPAKVEAEGTALVSGTVVANFLSNIKSEKISLELVGNNLTLATTQASSLVKTYPLEDFPTIPRLEAKQSFTMPTSDLFSGLKSVLYAASMSDIKPEIASVYVYRENSSLFFVATDSFRLAEKKIELSAGDGDAFKAIIPLKNAIELARVLEGAGESVTLDYDQHQLSLTGEHFYLTSRLVEGVFPDYRQIMPRQSTTELVVGKEELLSALRLANIFSDRLNRINLKIVPEESFAEISSKNVDVGENTVKLSPQAVSGEEIEVIFNVKYILDCLSFVTTPELGLRFVGTTKPLMVQAVGDSSFTYLIMPLNR